MDLYVVFHNSADFPGKYVVRKQTAGPQGVTAAPKPLALGTTLARVRAALPEGLTRLERDPSDVPSIVEVWV